MSRPEVMSPEPDAGSGRGTPPTACRKVRATSGTHRSAKGGPLSSTGAEHDRCHRVRPIQGLHADQKSGAGSVPSSPSDPLPPLSIGGHMGSPDPLTAARWLQSRVPPMHRGGAHRRSHRQGPGSPDRSPCLLGVGFPRQGPGVDSFSPPVCGSCHSHLSDGRFAPAGFRTGLVAITGLVRPRSRQGFKDQGKMPHHVDREQLTFSFTVSSRSEHRRSWGGSSGCSSRGSPPAEWAYHY